MSNSNNKIKFLPLNAILGDRRLKKRLRPEYVEACRFFSSPLIDRTGTLESGVDFDVLDALDDFSETDKNFAEICDERATFIAQKAIRQNRKIQLLWSGGIDSTLALVSLFKELEKREELQRLEVLLSKESIEEYRSFFEEVIRKKLNYILFNPPIYSRLDTKKIIVTGEHGDQIFGSDKARHFVITKQAFRPYTEILPCVIARKLGSDKSVDAIISYLEPQIKKSSVPVKTLFDYLWWMNFSLKWQHVSLRMIYSMENINLSLDENIIHFFSAKDFQNWSVKHHDKKIKNSWKSYKYVAKEYIFDFHRDENYLINKEKEQSLKDAIVSSPTLITILKRPFRKLMIGY